MTSHQNNYRVILVVLLHSVQSTLQRDGIIKQTMTSQLIENLLKHLTQMTRIVTCRRKALDERRAEKKQQQS